MGSIFRGYASNSFLSTFLSAVTSYIGLRALFGQEFACRDGDGGRVWLLIKCKTNVRVNPFRAKLKKSSVMYQGTTSVVPKSLGGTRALAPVPRLKLCSPDERAQGLKPSLAASRTARLKSCPDTKHRSRDSRRHALSRSLFSPCGAIIKLAQLVKVFVVYCRLQPTPVRE